ncbi:zinc finger protein 501-like isoform X1 [Zerene cesonia]|uniref:zinc finger protein 501-like isoform X1 n=1 Tax=Zerene cesonia TaxID=33412 RepID=UPI0018E4EA03|nr:zinc finger protein 501-like isoform X1 [Zerene cesonia]
MSIQVDIKALVSHIVKGDGLDKCRICMGSTKEGRVFLGDTVMMDEGKAVTLAEVLENITGIQMQLQDDLPAGICTACSVSALSAAEFRALCHKANSQWDIFIDLLENLPASTDKQSTAIFAVINKNEMMVIDDFNERVSRDTAATKLTAHLSGKPQRHTYTCTECSKTFRYPHQLYIHLKESTDMKRACYVCGDIMIRDLLVPHLNNSHNRKPIECKDCPALLISYDQYNEHQTKFHAPSANVCIDCGQSFQSINAQHAHMSIHTPKSCPRCDKIFKNQKCYIHHFKNCCIDKIKKTAVSVIGKAPFRVGSRGSVDKTCICDYCGKAFAGRKIISAHIQIVHMKNTHQPCIHCGKLLAAAHMPGHMKSHDFNHTFKCDQCGMVLKSRLGYVQHLRLHSGERPYACEQCGETFSTSSRRSEHVRRTHKKSEIVLKHACTYCAAKFRLPYRLRRHLLTMHSNECDAPEMKYKCTVCNERFGTCRGLVHHSKKHQNVLLFKRQIRDAEFRVLNST